MEVCVSYYQYSYYLTLFFAQNSRANTFDGHRVKSRIDFPRRHRLVQFILFSPENRDTRFLRFIRQKSLPNTSLDSGNRSVRPENRVSKTVGGTLRDRDECRPLVKLCGETKNKVVDYRNAAVLNHL